MKTRIRRFWISVSLAASSLAIPLSAPLRAHDLPTRWTSGTNSSSSWNYLLDDCLDSRALTGLNNYAASLNDGCFAEGWADTQATDSKSASSLWYRAGFASQMAGWVSRFEQLRQGVQKVAAGKLLVKAEPQKISWALRPELGTPPAPASSPYQMTDTCAYEAEYLAQRSAAELLDGEIARASKISADEAALASALAAAAELEASAIDNLPAPNDLAILCGGERREIVTANPPVDRFLPGMIDGYMAHENDDYASHWLGGLGKSWKLRTALGAAPSSTVEQIQAELAGAHVAPPEWTAEAIATPIRERQAANDHYELAELIEAPGFEDLAADDDPTSWDEAIASYASPVANDESLAADEAYDLDEMAMLYGASDSDANYDSSSYDGESIAAEEDTMSEKYASGMATGADDYTQYDYAAYEAQRGFGQSTANALANADADEDYSLDRESYSDALPALEEPLARVLQWMEDVECNLSAELCGFDSASRLGANLAALSVDAVLPTLVAATERNDPALPPAVVDPGVDLYVVYTDSDGSNIAVPSSLARAWNRPERDDSNPPALNGKVYGPMTAAEAARNAPTALDLPRLKSLVLSLVARQLDSLGITCLQTADHLSNWAGNQIASREDSDIR